jgi:hypothetical protein
MYELNAAGETTNDLLANLIEVLKEATDSNFQRWLSNQVDLWWRRLKYITKKPSTHTDWERKDIDKMYNMHSKQQILKLKL